MNYLHPQLFFPISLFFSPSPSSRSWRGAFWSRFLWRKSDSKFRREVVLSLPPHCPNISLRFSFLSSLLPPSRPLLLSLSTRDSESWGALRWACLWPSGCYPVNEHQKSCDHSTLDYLLYAVFHSKCLEDEPAIRDAIFNK